MQQVNFGKVEKLQVRGGEPVFNPSPRIVKEIKFGGENGPRQELKAEDFVLKAQVVEFFSCLTSLGNGMVETLDIKHGLPFRMNMEEAI
jgi:hypothetical protein